MTETSVERCSGGLLADRDGGLLLTMFNTFENANQLPAPVALTVTRIEIR
ncbi:MAG: hypothetical protein IPP40_11185 [bacterium]|nr:hypothetical protein [bacterium]